jgi:uncharacterized protein (DUF1499 family)
MTSLKFIPIVLALLVVAYLIGLSFTTRHNRLKPEDQRQLSPCPDKPNCVSSLAGQDVHAIDAFIPGALSPQQSWQKLIAAVTQSGGEILVDDGRYCHAVFTSGLFRFKDDFEAVLDGSRIEIRSASRAGTSDMGQNRKRVERIRRLYMGTSVEE